MIELSVLFLNSLFCFGLYISFTEGMILHPFVRLYELLTTKQEEVYEGLNVFIHPVFKYLSKPLYSCTICMASIWGIVFVAYSGLTDYPVISLMMLFHIVCVAGLNFLIGEFIDSLKRF